MKLHRVLTSLTLIVAGGLAGAAGAQPFPTQRLTLVVPLAAGGPTDLVARIVGPEFEARWKQPAIVENRVGGGGMLGNAAVARAAPDGHTILVTGNGVVTAKIFIKDPGFEASDLVAAAQLVWSPRVVVVHPSVPARTMQEFLAYAKTRPKSLNYAMIPNTSFELDYILFAQKAGIEMTAVPYQGIVPGLQGLVRGDVQFMFTTSGTPDPQVAAGALTMLAVTPAHRIGRYPNMPTIREGGLDYEQTTSFGLFVPARTPADVVAKIGSEVVSILQVPAVGEKIRKLGFEPSVITPRQWREQLAAEGKSYAEAAQRVGVKPQ